MSRWRDQLTGLALAFVIVMVVGLLGWAAEASGQVRGSTSQSAFSRCGETHLTVTNNTADGLDVVMFGKYARLEVGGTAVFWTDEEVTVDRVTRRGPGQHYHTSVTSVFTVEDRECTIEWATL